MDYELKIPPDGCGAESTETDTPQGVQAVSTYSTPDVQASLDGINRKLDMLLSVSGIALGGDSVED